MRTHVFAPLLIVLALVSCHGEYLAPLRLPEEGPTGRATEAAEKGPTCQDLQHKSVSSALSGLKLSVLNPTVLSMTVVIDSSIHLGDIVEYCGLCDGKEVNIPVKHSAVLPGPGELLEKVQACVYQPGQAAQFFFRRRGEREIVVRTIFRSDTGEKVAYGVCRYRVWSDDFTSRAEVCEVRPRYFRD